jgi:hypothetical protein
LVELEVILFPDAASRSYPLLALTLGIQPRQSPSVAGQDIYMRVNLCSSMGYSQPHGVFFKGIERRKIGTAIRRVHFPASDMSETYERERKLLKEGQGCTSSFVSVLSKEAAPC